MSDIDLDPPDDAAALLFDCDGTLVDSLGLYRICWHQVFGRHGFELTDEWFAARVGLTARPFVRAAFPDAEEDVVAAIQDEGMSMFMESIHLLEPMEHVVDIARRYHGRLPIAVVSSGLPDAVHRSLDAAGITELFDFVLTLETVPNAKPAPDGYLLAAQRFGVAPNRCVAYEDSEAGIESALAAGIGTVFDVRRPKRITP
jgi:HAD superfamily hydrolase (TIGR01509 family)